MTCSKLLLAGAAALTLSACDAPMRFKAPLSGAAEAPPDNSRGTGMVEATIFPSTKAMTYTGEFQGLTGPVTAAHFHGPAPAGGTAPPVIPINDTTSPIKGGQTLTDAQIADIAAGRYYVNLHTAAYPNGEVRGQLRRVQ